VCQRPDSGPDATPLVHPPPPYRAHNGSPTPLHNSNAPFRRVINFILFASDVPRISLVHSDPPCQSVIHLSDFRTCMHKNYRVSVNITSKPTLTSLATTDCGTVLTTPHGLSHSTVTAPVTTASDGQAPLAPPLAMKTTVTWPNCRIASRFLLTRQ
jgi:hypothetical protein